ncbi:MAG: CDP-diacylglycerol--glycerol-3-phosphate 3-phosphatidyltransferase [Candidatus Omnitrophica bacterium]|nr:CDP-diacylglycerol--glycerol-3-phosphate 3-phosphatidyltransferase [Candidatus Omnitrophota bacterium]
MNIPTKITIARILAVPFFVSCIVYYTPDSAYFKWLATAIFLLASLSDALDGYLARVRNEQSTLGAILDPFADKLLLISAFLSINFSAGFHHKVANWVLIVIVSREIILISGLLIVFFSSREFKVNPTLLGKATTVAQMATVGAMLLEFSWAPASGFVAALLTIVSGLGYIYRETKRLNDAGSGY